VEKRTILAILNGDDFGVSPGINRGIMKAHREGILTSASSMVAGEAFEEAVALAHKHPNLSLGVPLTLVEGVPVLPPGKVPSLETSDGRFYGSLRAFLLKWLSSFALPIEVTRYHSPLPALSPLGACVCNRSIAYARLHKGPILPESADEHAQA
jgi:YdjC-like protein